MPPLDPVFLTLLTGAVASAAKLIEAVAKLVTAVGMARNLWPERGERRRVSAAAPLPSAKA